MGAFFEIKTGPFHSQKAFNEPIAVGLVSRYLQFSPSKPLNPSLKKSENQAV
jgi:hypothetical protein